MTVRQFSDEFCERQHQCHDTNQQLAFPSPISFNYYDFPMSIKMVVVLEVVNYIFA